MDSSPATVTQVEKELAARERSISWLARKVGVHPSYAWKMLRGVRPITDDFKAATAAALGLPESELFPVATAS